MFISAIRFCRIKRVMIMILLSHHDRKEANLHDVIHDVLHIGIQLMHPTPNPNQSIVGMHNIDETSDNTRNPAFHVVE